MFAAIFKYDWAVWLRKPSLYAFALAFFGLPLLLFIGTGGYFDPPAATDEGQRLWLNSPAQISTFLQSVGKALLFLLPAVVGTTIHQDFQYDVHKLLYAYPINKAQYLGAKLCSTLSIVMLIALLPSLAFIVGEGLLGAQHSVLGPFRLEGYAFATLYLVLPNLLVFGTLVFGAVALSRNVYSGFALMLALFVFQAIVEQLFHEKDWLLALLDPFGQQAVLAQTKYWATAEQNSTALALTPSLWQNRLLWLLIAAGGGLLTLLKFELAYFGWADGLWLAKPKQRKERPKAALSATAAARVRVATGFKCQVRQLGALVRNDLRFMLAHWLFWSLCAIGILLVVLMLNRMLQTEQVTMLPLTRIILGVPAFFYINIVMLATFLFSGMMLARVRDTGMASLVYATPSPTWAFAIAPVASLLVVQTVFLSLLMITGLAVQSLLGYYFFDIPQYLSALWLFAAPTLATWALVSVAVHSWFRNLYLGLFVLLLAWLAQFSYEDVGIHSRLLQFNTYTMPAYNDMDGFGHAATGQLVLKAYWCLWGLLALALAGMSWPREYAYTLKERWALASSRARRWQKGATGVLLALLAVLAGFIFQAEQATYTVPEDRGAIEDFEAQYGFLEQLPQPRITAVSLALDIFPEKKAFRAKGEYALVNKTGRPLDTLVVKVSIDELSTYSFDRPSRLLDSVEGWGFGIHVLASPLLPEDTLRLSFSIQNRSNTLFQRNANVLGNGTLLTQDILPRIGYFLRRSSPDPQRGAPSGNHYQAWDSDLVKFEAVVSTCEGQIALANGALKGQWKEGGRHFFRYQSQQPIKFNFYFCSGRYQVHREQEGSDTITIYYHPEHGHNLGPIAEGAKAALAFNTKRFGHAPDGEIRVIEYPLSEGTFSTLKSSAIVMSEKVFGVNTSEEGKLNLPFYIAAHEMTHHWFGNMLMPSHATGALLLTEGITEYLTLQLFKAHFGQERGLEFLSVQHERYLRGRANATAAESPLHLVRPGQDYLAYGKGAIALNTLAHYLGQERFDRFLFKFLEDWHSTLGVYPTSLDFQSALMAEAPDSLHALIDELLAQSVIYNHQLLAGSTVPDGRAVYKTTVSVASAKFENGLRVDLQPGATVELALYDAKGTVLEVIELPVRQASGEVEVWTKERPYQAVLDHALLVIDKDRRDNRLVLE